MAYKIKNSKSKEKDTYAVSTPKKSEQPIISNVGSARVFRINDRMEIRATSESTRNGFRHIAKLYVDGKEVDKSTVHYLNRTWESYEYQSVIHDLINKSSYVSKEDKEQVKKKFEEASHQKIKREFGSIGNIAQLGDVLGGETLKEKNAFKLRMLKAGLGSKGFEVPENWDKLSEKEKAKRLDQTIKLLKEN